MGNRRRKRLKVAVGFRPARYNPGRGRDYFVIALIVLPIMVGASAVTGSPVSPSGAVAFVLGISALAGVVGTFTDNVGF
jgi:hypothetical protein